MIKFRLAGFFFCMLFSITCSFAQPTPAGDLTEEGAAIIKQYEDTLGVLGFTIVNDSLPDHRFASCKKFILTLVKALKTENSFNYPFERLKSISILYPPDSTFRVFSWQLYVDKDDYRYYGAIQMNTKELALHPLMDRSFEIEQPENRKLTPDQWYGAIYYNLKAFKTKEGEKYLLFGFDGNEFFHKKKVVDVLYFEKGQPFFGAPVFEKAQKDENLPPNTFHRLTMEYSAEASVRLNYDEYLKMITFDHLIQIPGSYPGQGMTNVPDGSYSGYEFKKGKWVYVEKLFDQVQDTPPREEPILDTRSEKDLFGKPKKN